MSKKRFNNKGEYPLNTLFVGIDIENKGIAPAASPITTTNTANRFFRLPTLPGYAKTNF